MKSEGKINNPYKPGDIVRLKSGSQSMTVRSVKGKTVSCEWSYEAQICSHKFVVEQLELYLPASSKWVSPSLGIGVLNKVELT